MEAVHLHKVVANDGELLLSGLPFSRGQSIAVTLRVDSVKRSTKKGMTARDILNSDLIGLWKDRKDIQDSSIYARKLREQAQRRDV